LAYNATDPGWKKHACILNAANEMAVAAFLDEKIRFTQLPEVVEYTMENSLFHSLLNLDFLTLLIKMQGKQLSDLLINFKTKMTNTY